MNRVLVIVVIAMAACQSPTVPERLARDVYRYELQTSSGLRVLRWPVGQVVKVFVVEHTDAARTSALRAALANAVEVWNSAVLYGEVQLQEVRNVSEADAVLSFFGSALPLETGQCTPSGSDAFTTFCLTGDGQHLEGFPIVGTNQRNVKFLVTLQPVLPFDPIEVTRLVTHEMGHVLGIAQHSPLATDLMHSDARVAARPTARDRATLQALYHTAAEITP
jgi:predicted Zn-dependent protease